MGEKSMWRSCYNSLLYKNYSEKRENVRIEIIVIASASYGIGIDGLEMGYLSPL